MEGLTRIELASSVWKTEALPLSYSPEFRRKYAENGGFSCWSTTRDEARHPKVYRNVEAVLSASSGRAGRFDEADERGCDSVTQTPRNSGRDGAVSDSARLLGVVSYPR